MPTLIFEGTVFSGKGEGKKFITLPWVKEQIEAKLGFSPFPGTLNLRLTQESTQRKGQLKTAETADITPQAGYCRGLLIKAQISNMDGAIVLPQIPDYPQDVLEVIAAVCLREKLKLADGDGVAVCVSV